MFKYYKKNILQRLILLSIIFTFAQFNIAYSQEGETTYESPYYIFPREGNQHIDLGTDWTLSCMDKELINVDELPGLHEVVMRYPSSIHMAIHSSGKLPHPYVGLNSKQYRWIEEKVWYYQKSVEIPVAAKGDYILLRFDGVDYFSKVWVNGKQLAQHEGMFGGPTIDISEHVDYGENNEIVLEVKAGNWGNKATDYENLPYNSDGVRDLSKRQGFNSRKIGKIIKPWIISGGSGTEAFFSVGMWQGARIEIVPRSHLERPFIRTNYIDSSKAKIHLSTEILVNSNSTSLRLHPWGNAQLNHPNAVGTEFVKVEQKYQARVQLSMNGNTAFSNEFELELNEGRNWLEKDIIITSPKLWNPTGLGEPNLYDVNIELLENSEVIDKISIKHGIRTVDRIATAGPRTADRWENWQFIVNGKKIFIKGMNWTPIDILLDMPESRYRWALEAAKNMGIQMIRVWGGGLIEKDFFYEICDELGIMVWQDFPIGNQDTPDFPQKVWESQVVQNIFRLRNHASLAVWCGGNEFNPYSLGNATSIGILERNIDIFDGTRMFVRTTPDDGSMHAYPDMDPFWYKSSYKFEAWVTETGMHSMPEPNLFYELVNKEEFKDLGKMWDKTFGPKHPEFIHHFTEYGPNRVPRMLSRASHINNMKDPSIDEISEATQIGAGEWYQIISENIQGNYPITSGLMPWVFKRHWPVIAIQMMDWFGQPVAPYYFLKRTYEPTHVSLDLGRLLWKSGEKIDLNAKIINSTSSIDNALVVVKVYDQNFNQLFIKETATNIPNGTSVTDNFLGSYTIGKNVVDEFLLIVVELKHSSGDLISRSVYYPRILSQMNNPEFYNEYVNNPIPWIALDKGPWLKPTVANSKTKLNMKIISNKELSQNENKLLVKVKNHGKIPAFMTHIDIEGAKRIFYADDNYFWLPANEEVLINIKVQWRDPQNKSAARVSLSSWNSKEISKSLND